MEPIHRRITRRTRSGGSPFFHGHAAARAAASFHERPSFLRCWIRSPVLMFLQGPPPLQARRRNRQRTTVASVQDAWVVCWETTGVHTRPCPPPRRRKGMDPIMVPCAAKCPFRWTQSRSFDRFPPLTFFRQKENSTGEFRDRSRTRNRWTLDR